MWVRRPVAAASGQLELSVGTGNLERHTGISVVIIKSASLSKADMVAVERDELI